MKFDHFLTSYTKVNSTWIQDLNVRQGIIKTLESTGKNFFDTDCSNFLLDTSPEARETKAKINYCNFVKTKSSARRKKQTTNLIKDDFWNGRRYLKMTNPMI